MSKQVGTTCAFLFYGLLVAYFIYEVKAYAVVESYEDFLHTYIYNVQKILFNINLVITILAYYRKMPILKAEYRVRYKSQFTRTLILELFLRSVFVSLATLVLFGIPFFLYQGTGEGLIILIKSVLIIFLYTFAWSAGEKLFYVCTGNLVIGIVSCAVLSFMISIVHSYLVFDNILPRQGDGYMTPFMIVVLTVGMASTTLLVRKSRRIECLA